jgi:hypothetical protein
LIEIPEIQPYEKLIVEARIKIPQGIGFLKNGQFIVELYLNDFRN